MPSSFPYRPLILPIKELLGRDFTIPPYQRPYVWTEENVRGLVASLIKTSEQDDPDAAPYRLGTIILVTNGSDQNWEIIDGQQRIITLFLILKALSEKTALEEPFLLASKRSGSLKVSDLTSIRHIAKNYRSIRSFLSPLDRSRLKKLVEAIGSRTEVLSVEATFEQDDLEGREELLRLFHDQNARGKDLSVGDRLKAIHLAKIQDPGLRRQKAVLFEAINQKGGGVDELIEKVLFPVRRWGKRLSAAHSILEESDVGVRSFLGIDPSHPYPYAVFHRAGLETRHKEHSWQFDQPFLAGEGFFDLLERASSDLENARACSAPRKEVLRTKIYEELYLPSLAYLLNRFGMEGLEAEPAAFKFALAINRWLKVFRSESVDRYARGYALSMVGGRGFPFFEAVGSVSSPGELMGGFYSKIPFPNGEGGENGKGEAEAIGPLPRIDLVKRQESSAEERLAAEETGTLLWKTEMESPSFRPLIDEKGGNIFDRDCFIPSYQRDFAWEEEGETKELIDDLLDVDGERYLIGSFVLSKKVDGRGREKLEVVDGQQRLTVLYLLFRVLGLPVAHPLEYESGRESLAKADRGGDGNEASTYRYLTKYLEDDDRRRRIKSNLKKTYVLLNFLPPKTDLNNYFETMNGTGVDLSDADLVKASVYQRLATGGQGKAGQFVSLFNEAQSFFSGERSGGGESEKPLTLEEASRQCLDDPIDHEEMGSSPIDFRLFLLYVLLSVDEKACTVFKAKKLVPNFEANFGNGAKDGAFADKFLDKLALDFELIKKYTIRRAKSGGFSFEALDTCHDDSQKPILKRIMMLQEAACQLRNFFRKDGWVLQLLKKGSASREVKYEELEEMLLDEFRQPTKDFLDEEADNHMSIPPFSVLYFLDYLIWKKMAQGGEGKASCVAGQKPFANIASFSFGQWRSIEHFYPQHPANGEYVDPPENVHLFGNLALLSKAENSRFSNNMPSSKIKNFGSKIQNMSLKLRLMAKAVESNDEGWRAGLSEKDESKRDPQGKEMLAMLADAVGWKDPDGH